MATTKFHNNVGEIVPWQAQYTFPSQATKSQKQTVKLVPKNGSEFDPQNKRIRIEFPSDGYLNFQNSSLKFDLTTTVDGAAYGSMYSGAIAVTVESNKLYAHVPVSTILFSSKPASKGFDDGAGGILIKNGYKIRFTFNARTGEDVFARVSETEAPTLVQKSWIIGGETDNTAANTIKIPLAPVDSTFRKTLFGNSNEAVFVATTSATDSDGVERWKALTFAEPNVRLPKQGGHALIRRLRILYGGMVLEDIQEYSTLARIMYDTTVAQEYMGGAGTLLEGTFHPSVREDSVLADPIYEFGFASNDAAHPTNSSTRQIILNCMSGILNSKKLFPLKWMAAQFAIEIELNDAARALIADKDLNVSYKLSNVSYISEILDFDSSFDYAFLTGLKSSGVPIKFSSWHWHTHNLQSLTQAQIHERARSIKAAFSVVKDTIVDKGVDYDIFYHDPNSSYSSSSGITQSSSGADIAEYQYRVGGKYHPAQPVDCTNGASEAYLELAKTINSLGDFTFSTSIKASDFSQHFCPPGRAATKFVMAMEFENTDVFPDTISGINGEEQSDINLTVKCKSALAQGTGSGKQLWTFVNYDALLVVRDGNIVELVM
jgi:hypothetical protein